VKMDRAIVMLTLEPDTGMTPLEEVRKIPGVIEAHILYGPYDAYVMVEAKNISRIQDIVINEIRSINGILSTMTSFIAG
jgi:DNA-binding Lrp family transcriptional regulator